MAKKKVQGGGRNTTEVAVVNTNPVEEQIVNNVVDDLEAIYVEKGKESRQLLIEAYSLIGRTLREAEESYRVSMPDLIQQCANDERMKRMQLGRTNLWFTLTVYDEYGKIIEKGEYEKLPEGENCSITKLKKLHTTPKPKREPTIEEIAEAFFNKYGEKMCKDLIKALQEVIKKK